jgi:mRNA-degrading endonuclease toxin of MazEF toxin-antitoxin module
LGGKTKKRKKTKRRKHNQLQRYRISEDRTDDKNFQIEMCNDSLPKLFKDVQDILDKEDKYSTPDDFQNLKNLEILKTYLDNIKQFSNKDPKYLKGGLSFKQYREALYKFNDYISAEIDNCEDEQFRQKLPFIKRRQIVFLDFNWGIGSEMKYPHFAVVVEKLKKRNPDNIMVVPLQTYKPDVHKTIEEPDLLLGVVEDLNIKNPTKVKTIAKVSQMRTIDKMRIIKTRKAAKKQLFLEEEYLDLIDEMIAKTYTNMSF